MCKYIKPLPPRPVCYRHPGGYGQQTQPIHAGLNGLLTLMARLTASGYPEIYR